MDLRHLHLKIRLHAAEGEQIGGEDAFDHLFGAWYDAEAGAFKGTDREVCSSIWEEYRTFSNPSLNPDAEAINAEAKLKMEAKQLAPYEEYIYNHGLTWPAPRRTASMSTAWKPTASTTRPAA